MTSILNKKWKILNASDASLSEKLLANRGFKNEAEIDENSKFHDPFDFDDMQKVIKRIQEAVEKKERIIVFGDYDVDGITAAAILVKTLQKLGAKVSYRLPHRVEDGYGLKEKFIKEFVELKVELVITVDCGISCKNEIELAKKHGIDVIITDHHTVPKKPPKAFAILHPELSGYPFKHLTGAGVAFKLAQALIENADEFLDLAAMGTVADIGLLVGENRFIVKKGLQILAKTNLEGLQFLKELAGIIDGKIDAHTIGFQIGPRINAAGRIDTPYFALQLLLNENKEKGKRLARKLEELNRKRQDMTKKALEEAEKYFEKQSRKFILIKEDKNWHVGILGLIAGRLSEKYSLPSIILQDFGDYLTASARSPEHFNIIEALTENAKYLTYFGGHAQAAGFEISKKHYAEFKKTLEKYAAKKLAYRDIRPTLKVECEIDEKDINEKTLEFLDNLKPFGAGNEAPNFLLKNLDVTNIREVGKDRTHLKISARKGKHDLGIIAFQFAEHAGKLREHKKIDAVVSLEKNTRKGYEGIQIKAVDFRASQKL